MKSSKKNISVIIGIDSLEDETHLENLKNKFKDFSEEISIDIDFEYGMVPDPIWDEKKFKFSVLDSVPNIINILEVYIPKSHRRKGYGSKVLQAIWLEFGPDSVIFAELSLLTKEFNPMKYAVVDDGTGKEIIDVKKVIQDNIAFFTKNGFAAVDGYLHKDDNKFMMIAYTPIGALMEQYMQDTIVTKNHIVETSVQRMYRKYAANLMEAINSNDVIIFPYEGFVKEIETSLKLPEDIKDRAWYSKYEIQPDEDPKRLLVNSKALKNMSFLKCIGGYECETFLDTPGLTRNCMYFKVQEGYISDENIENKSEFAYFEGYGLYSDGIWYPKKWAYDTERFIIVTDNIDILALVGCMVENPN